MQYIIFKLYQQSNHSLFSTGSSRMITMSPTDLTALLLFCVFSNVAEAGKEWCHITCLQENRPPVHHIMCDYPEDGGDTCNGWSHGISAEEKQILLDYHNRLRQRVANGQETRGLGGKPPMASDMMELVWDTELEEVAQRWANQCREEDNDKCHVANDGTEVGQNVANKQWTNKIVDRKEALKIIVQDWYNEIDKFYTSDVDSVFTNSNKGEVRHFTQVVWASTTYLGCGFSHYQETEREKSVFRLVCNYKAAGNVRFMPLYTRAVHTKACPPGTSSSERYPGLCLSQKEDSMLQNTVQEHGEVPTPSAVTQHTSQNKDGKPPEVAQLQSQLLPVSQNHEVQQEEGKQIGQYTESRQEQEGHQPNQKLDQKLEGQEGERQEIGNQQKERQRKRFRLTAVPEMDQENLNQLTNNDQDNQELTENPTQQSQSPSRMKVQMIPALSNRPLNTQQIMNIKGSQTSLELIKQMMARRGSQPGTQGSSPSMDLIRQVIMHRALEPGKSEGRQPDTSSDLPGSRGSSPSKIALVRLLTMHRVPEPGKSKGQPDTSADLPGSRGSSPSKIALVRLMTMHRVPEPEKSEGQPDTSADQPDKPTGPQKKAMIVMSVNGVPKKD